MSTPQATPKKDGPVADSPGTWRHPRMEEISRRRSATTFSDKNIHRIASNVAFLVVTLSVQLVAKLKINPNMYGSSPLLSSWLTNSVSPSFRLYLGWVWFALQMVPLAQILYACLPLVRPVDDLSDIPLTSEQRRLLGLLPSSAPPTPDAKFSTPPRYSRTPSLSGSVGSRGSYNSSPLSGRGSPMPSPGSPLFAKGNGLAGRKPSIGASTTSANLFGEHVSPSGGKRTSVGLNNKWLYEKGRRSSGLY